MQLKVHHHKPGLQTAESRTPGRSRQTVRKPLFSSFEQTHLPVTGRSVRSSTFDAKQGPAPRASAATPNTPSHHHLQRQGSLDPEVPFTLSLSHQLTCEPPTRLAIGVDERRERCRRGVRRPEEVVCAPEPLRTRNRRCDHGNRSTSSGCPTCRSAAARARATRAPAKEDSPR